MGSSQRRQLSYSACVMKDWVRAQHIAAGLDQRGDDGALVPGTGGHHGEARARLFRGFFDVTEARHVEAGRKIPRALGPATNDTGETDARILGERFGGVPPPSATDHDGGTDHAIG